MVLRLKAWESKSLPGLFNAYFYLEEGTIKVPGKKIFLDIGSHIGETLIDVFTDDYLFDEIHCFEPMVKPFEKLKSDFEGKTGNAKLFFNNFGLASFSGEKEIYGVNLGASMFADKVDIENNLVTKCNFVSASDYFRENLSKDDLVIVKINCEGGEVQIINDLLDSGEIFKMDHMMVDFDARKIPSMYDAPKQVLRRMKKAKFKNYCLPRGVLTGRNGSIRNWLGAIHCSEQIMKNPLSIDQ